MTPATLAATLLIVATLADIASTEYALRRGLSEGNPVAAKLMSHFGKFWGLPKLALAAWIFIERSDKWAWLIAALAVALLVIAANNVRMAKRRMNQ